MYLDLFTSLVIGGSILWVGGTISRDLKNLRNTLNVSIDALSATVQEQTDALVGPEDEESEEDEGTVPVNS